MSPENQDTIAIDEQIPSRLHEAEMEAEETNVRYSTDEVLEAVMRALSSNAAIN